MGDSTVAPGHGGKGAKGTKKSLQPWDRELTGVVASWPRQETEKREEGGEETDGDCEVINL